MERTNTKDIVSKVAYLIGVKKTVLYNQFETERPGYLKELDENQNARTIRSLCKLRMTLLHRFKKIDDMLRFELKNLKTIEFFDKDDIKQLEKWEIPYDEIVYGKVWPGHKGFYVDDRTIRPDEFMKYTPEELEKNCEQSRQNIED